MKKRKVEEYDLPEMTAKMFKSMRPAGEVHPQLVAANKRSRGRPPKAARKVPVTLRLDAEVVTALKASGPGWQTRANDHLAKWAKKLASQKSVKVKRSGSASLS